MDRRRAVLVMAAGAATLTLAACGSGGTGSSTKAQQPASAGSASAEPGAGSAAMPSTNMLMVKQSGTLGKIVTDQQGHTLYRYGKDMKDMSMCTGECAKKWPPVMPEGTPQAMGVSPKLVGVITRSDGMKQVTLGGWPLYRYTGDAAAGQSKGQGVGGAWHAVAPTGKMAMGGQKGSSGGGTGSGGSGSMPGMDMGSGG